MIAGLEAPNVSLIVFAYNEAENIPTVLLELRAWLEVHEPSAQIVFVDDGSSDGTLAAARAVLTGFSATFLRHESNRGIGAALKTAVTSCEARWVTFLPADGQIEPAAIGTLLAAARKDDVDIVLSTYDDRDDGWQRTLLSFGVRALIFLVHGVRMQSDGPYLFRRELFQPQELPSDSFFLNFEFPILVLARGLPSANVVIHCRPRRAGVSKSTGLKRVAGVARDLIGLRIRRGRERSANR